mgnify:CR=1 FL=1
MSLSEFVTHFAEGMMAADTKRPQAINQRSKEPYQPGIGPHIEAATVELVIQEIQAMNPNSYRKIQTGISYPHDSRKKCDLFFDHKKQKWFVEVKMMRLMGDNGKSNDNILMHILSPYPQHRSALTDCEKLLSSGFDGKKAVLIYGYDYDEFPLVRAIDAFEILARRDNHLGERIQSNFENLIHPVHQRGAVFAWELEEKLN